MSPTVEIRRVLCPVDYSPSSRQALGHAAAIAGWYGATLTVLHAYLLSTPPFLRAEYPGEYADDAPTAAPEDVSAAGEQVLTQLAAFTEPIEATGVPLELEYRHGRPVASILERARTLPADLIVMGTHGRSGVDRLVLGSVAEQVLRQAACPVLTAPPADRETRRFRRILCGVDFSEPSMTALRYARALAGQSGAVLIVLHVIEGIPDAEHWQQPDLTLTGYLRVADAEARARLDRAIPREARRDHRIEEVRATGKPYREVLRLARERDVDLIVLGVRGRNPIDVMLFGSTTQHVVRMAECPVLTLRA